jgi:hypothetical protein
MNTKPLKKEVGIVWRLEQQLIRLTLERMVNNCTLGKLSTIADETGMTEDEFRSKISMNPRTPMTWDERIAIENLIFKLDETEFVRYLQQFHLSNFVVVRADLKRVAV